MSVAVESDASTVRKEFFFSFSLDANNSADDFGKLRSRTRSFSSFWEKGCGASSASSLGTTSSLSSTLENSSSLNSGSSAKTGTGISSQ